MALLLNKAVAGRFGLSLVAVLLLAIVGWLAWSYFQDGVVAAVVASDVPAEAKLDHLREFFHSLGAAAPLVYVLLVTVEVTIAPIPGALLYAPGGVIFGGFWGGLLSLVGNVLGAGIACGLMRRLGRGRAESFIKGHALDRYESALARNGVFVVFLLRVNPLTSCDLVSYAAGVTSMPIWKVMLGTLLGMAPLCWAQAYLAEGLLTAFPSLLYPLLAVCLVYVAGGAWLLRWASRQRETSPEAPLVSTDGG